MSITSDLIRGHTDTIILAHLINGDSYGYQINKCINRESGGKFELKEATLYSAFKRLEGDGMIVSYWGDSDGGGARRRYYSITDKGRAAYRALFDEWKEACIIISNLIDTISDDGGNN